MLATFANLFKKVEAQPVAAKKNEKLNQTMLSDSSDYTQNVSYLNLSNS